jgi:hypothetical protein
VTTMKNKALAFSPLLGVTITALVLASAPFAHAFTAVLTISDGVNTVAVLDQVGSDSNAAPGTVEFKGVFGLWNIDAVGQNLGTANQPKLSLSSTETSTGVGTLTIDFSDINFSVASPFSYTNHIGGLTGTGGGSMSVTTWASTSNVVTQKTTALTSGQSGLSGFFNSDKSGNTSVGSPFSLTVEDVVNQSTGGGTSSFGDTLTIVPEPSVWALCTFGVAGLFLGRRSLRRRA